MRLARALALALALALAAPAFAKSPGPATAAGIAAASHAGGNDSTGHQSGIIADAPAVPWIAALLAPAPAYSPYIKGRRSHGSGRGAVGTMLPDITPR